MARTTRARATARDRKATRATGSRTLRTARRGSASSVEKQVTLQKNVEVEKCALSAASQDIDRKISKRCINFSKSLNQEMTNGAL